MANIFDDHVVFYYERIVQDIPAYCEQILLTNEGGADREKGLRQLVSQFHPHHAVDLAYRTEKKLSDQNKLE